MILDCLFSDERSSLPYYVPSDHASNNRRSFASTKSNLLPRFPFFARNVENPNGSSPPSPSTGLIVGLTVFLVLFFLLNVLWISIYIWRRNKRLKRHLGTYHQPGDSRSLLTNAAPPSITIQRPSLNISRPISDPSQGPTPIFGFPSPASELPAQVPPSYPAAPYDPHGPRSPSISPPAYASEYAAPRSSSSHSRSSSASRVRNNSFAPAPASGLRNTYTFPAHPDASPDELEHVQEEPSLPFHTRVRVSALPPGYTYEPEIEEELEELELREEQRERGVWNADIDIAMRKALVVPVSPLSPGGERAVRADAARGWRGEWYRSQPSEERRFA